MTKENQNTVWNESWRDEYIKWICGLANAQGGTLYIGISDEGIIGGVDDFEYDCLLNIEQFRKDSRYIHQTA